MTQDDDYQPWFIPRNRQGWPRWYQRWFEVWWIITGQWSLHRAWQAGYDRGAQAEYKRVVGNWGSLSPILREFIDVTWGYANEDESVPSTDIQNRIIAQVRQKMDAVSYGRHHPNQ